jgi:hypothetical protein
MRVQHDQTDTKYSRFYNIKSLDAWLFVQIRTMLYLPCFFGYLPAKPAASSASIPASTWRQQTTVFR